MCRRISMGPVVVALITVGFAILRRSYVEETWRVRWVAAGSHGHGNGTTERWHDDPPSGRRRRLARRGTRTRGLRRDRPPRDQVPLAVVASSGEGGARDRPIGAAAGLRQMRPGAVRPDARRPPMW